MTVNQEEILISGALASNTQTTSYEGPVTRSKKNLVDRFKKKKRNEEKAVTLFNPSQVEARVIPINKIVYCHAIPSRPNSVILVWKHERALLCRVYVFSSVVKSFEFKNQLAMRFERGFRAWQFQFCRQSFTKYSRKARKTLSRVHFCTPKLYKRK